MTKVTIETTDDLERTGGLAGLDRFLADNGLNRDPDVAVWSLAHDDEALVGCMGLAGDVIKCSAVGESARGQNLMGSMLIPLRYEAIDRGQGHLFVYTRPEYRARFASLGFFPLAEVPNLVVLLEDDPRGIARYLEGLGETRRDGAAVGSIVMHANPYTLGHEYLVTKAAETCDVVHVFVVGEDRSQFSYADRFAMVKAGIESLPVADRVVLHEGSRYVLSGSTFPRYFLFDRRDVDRAHAGIDLQLFRNHIAPALGIGHRFVGTEPLSVLTASYNREMVYWLETPTLESPPVQVHEIARVGKGSEPFVSAARVRTLLRQGRLDDVRELVPPTTYDRIVARQPEATDPS